MEKTIKTFHFLNENEITINEILDNFKNFSKLYSPVVKFKTDYKEVYTIPHIILSDKNEALPVFTDPQLLNYPYVSKPALDFLLYIFSSIKKGVVLFNPPMKENYSIKQVTLDLYSISLIIGFLQCLSDNDCDDPAVLFNKGFFHKANYLCFKNFSKIDPFLYSMILVMLGFYERALDIGKAIKDDRIYILEATIKKINGDYKGALEVIENIKDEKFSVEKNIQLAWIELLSGRPDNAKKIFNKFSGGIFKQEAFFGLAVSILSDKNLNRESLSLAIRYLSDAINMDGKDKISIMLYLGNLYYNLQDYIKAEDFYYKAFYLNPSTYIMSLIGMSEAKRGKNKESIIKGNLISIFDINSGIKVFSALPSDYLSNDKTIDEDIVFEEKIETPPIIQNIQENQEVKKETYLDEASLEPADISSRKLPKEKKEETKQNKTNVISVYETFSSMGEKNINDINKTNKAPSESFISRAVSFASALEEEFGKKIYFNYEGLTDIERKLRLTFIQKNLDQVEAIETVKNCSAFLCYFLKERYKGKLIEYDGFDPWSWPMIIPISNTEILTYPIARVWKILWTNSLPDQGWILKYTQYLTNEMESANKNKVYGLEAVRTKIRSSAEKIFEAEIEHKKTLTLASSLNETKDIEIARTGIIKIEKFIKEKFIHGNAPDIDGWRLLRCLGHIFTEILIKDFKALWFNVEGNDGVWSMELPWGSFIFPIGKVFKSAAKGESLTEYYDKLLSDRLKYSSMR